MHYKAKGIYHQIKKRDKYFNININTFFLHKSMIIKTLIIQALNNNFMRFEKVLTKKTMTGRFHLTKGKIKAFFKSEYIFN